VIATGRRLLAEGQRKQRDPNTDSSSGWARSAAGHSGEDRDQQRGNIDPMTVHRTERTR
jgi:hypothetical protein